MIKRPMYAIISSVLLVVVVGYIIERVSFLRRAERTVGIVTEISSFNGRCGTRRSKHDCTKFYAKVHFTPMNTENIYLLEISAGSKRGHYQPISFANLKKNDSVPVVYDPHNPKKSYEDSLWGVWGTPIMIFFFQIGSFFSSLTEGRRRKEQ